MKSLLLGALLSVILFVQIWRSQTIMAIDMGMDSLKVSITKPGTPMEIVLNRDSYRKTKNAIAFSQDNRYIGDSVLKIIRRYPQHSTMHPHYLIGKRFDSLVHKKYRENWPKVKFQKNEESGSILIDYGNPNNLYSIEALFAMLLNDARSFTETYIGGVINSMSLVVPAYFDQTSRLYLKKAAEIADIKINSIVDSNVASCLKYSIARRKDISSVKKRIMIVDVGAYKTDSSVFDCVSEYEDKGKKISFPHCKLKGYGFSLSGAADIDSCMFEILSKKFEKHFKIPYSDISNNRIDYALKTEVVRVKHVLSSVNDTKFNFEQIYDGQDWSGSFTRAEIEQDCSSLVEKMLVAIDQSLHVLEISDSKSIDSSTSIMDQVLLMGGGTRIPLVYNIIKNKTKVDSLKKFLNTDDDIALGASFKAAELSKFFRVAHIECDSATIFPIIVSYNKIEYENGIPINKDFTRKLFDIMKPNRVGKVLTLKNVTEEIVLTFSYDLTNVPYSDTISVIDSELISNVTINGISEAIEKHKDDYVYDRIKVHISHDNFGVLLVTGAEAVFKRIEKDKSMLDKLTSAFTGLFKENLEEQNDGEIIENLNIINPENQNEFLKNEHKENQKNGKVDEKSVEERNTEYGSFNPKDKDISDNKEKEDFNKVENEDGKTVAENENIDNLKSSSNENVNESISDGDNKKMDENDKFVDDLKKLMNMTNGTVNFDSGLNNENSTKIENTKELEKPKIPKNTTENLNIETTILHLALPTTEDIKKYKDRLSEILSIEKQKEENDAARSNLESYIYEIKTKIGEKNEILHTFLNDTEFSTLTSAIDEAQNWFDEFGYSANSTECTEYKNKIRNPVKTAVQRSKEKLALIEITNSSNSTLTTTKNLFDHYLNMPEEFISKNENLYDSCRNSYNELEELVTKKYPEQILLHPWDEPILLSKDVKSKNRTLSQNARKLADNVIAYQKRLEELNKQAAKEEAEKSSTEDSTEGVTNETTKNAHDEIKDDKIDDTLTVDSTSNSFSNENTKYSDDLNSEKVIDESSDSTTKSDSSNTNDAFKKIEEPKHNEL